jgi:hypothetical protein
VGNGGVWIKHVDGKSNNYRKIRKRDKIKRDTGKGERNCLVCYESDG